MPTDRTYVYMHLPASGQFVPAGILDISQDAGGVISLFRYGHRYLERPDAIPLDPLQLPLSTREFQTTGIFGAFQDASPDSWGRHLLDRAAEEYGVRPTEFDYLTVLDQDSRIGALAFGPDLQGPRPHTPPWRPEIVAGDRLDLAGMLAAVDAIVNDEQLPPQFRRFLLRGSSVGGAKPKSAVDYEGRLWIAKFSEALDTWPTCRAEMAAMHLAARCGIRVPLCRVISVGGRDVFLIERFDRYGEHIRPQRRHFVSAMTLIGAGELTQGSYGDIARAIRRFGPPATLQQDLTELFRRMVFNILCNNSDDHLRNHGFLFDLESRMWRLSPVYDLVPQPQWDQDNTGRLSLGVGRQGPLATLDNALSRAADFGLKEVAAEKIVGEMAGEVRIHWLEEHSKAGVPEDKLPALQCSYRLAGSLLSNTLSSGILPERK
jgi:serine/threonine-protein kinase HipA